MRFDNVKIRCSALGNIMGQKGLGVTGEKYLTELFVALKYGRSRELVTKYTNKGLEVEEDSFTLVSRIHKRFYTKNQTNFKNEFITGTPDVVDGKAIRDMKSSWDMITYFHTSEKSALQSYKWQLQGYMALTGAEIAHLDYALVNTPIPLIEAEKRKKMYEMGIDMNDHRINLMQSFEDACAEIERLCVYDDVPLNERTKTFTIKRDADMIEQIYDRVKIARQWMNEQFGG
jgi:hypothetical protein